MTKTARSVEVFSIEGGAKALIEKSAPPTFGAARIAEDAKEINAAISKLRKLNPYTQDGIKGIWDAVGDLSFKLGYYGSDVRIEINVCLVPATKEDPWGTEYWRRTFEDEEREAREKKRAENSATRRRNKKIAA